MLYINFKGGGWLFPFYFGVAQYLKEHVDFQNETVKVGGVSAGSVTALLLLLDCDLYEIYLKTLRRYNEAKYNPFKMKECLNDILIEYIPDDPNEIAKYCGKLFVGLTKLDLTRCLVQPHVMTDYVCKDTCIDIIKASCHIPLISGFTPYYINGAGYFDGDISGMPEEEISGKRIDVSIRNSTVNSISPGIDLDEMWVFYPADPFVLKALFRLGYCRANQYVYENINIFKGCLQKTVKPYDVDELVHLHGLIRYSKKYNNVCMIRNPLMTLYHVIPKKMILTIISSLLLLKFSRKWFEMILSYYHKKRKTKRLTN